MKNWLMMVTSCIGNFKMNKQKPSGNLLHWLFFTCLQPTKAEPKRVIFILSIIALLYYLFFKAATNSITEKG